MSKKDKKLTPKQRLFVAEYLIDLNATQAAIRAGYSKKTAGSQGERLLKNVEIMNAVQLAMAKRAEKVEINAEWVLQKAKEVFERCMQEIPVEVWDKEQQCYVETGEYKFEAAAANKALEIIGKHVSVQAFITNLKLEGKIEHEHTHEIKESIDFNAIKDKRKLIEGKVH